MYDSTSATIGDFGERNNLQTRTKTNGSMTQLRENVTTNFQLSLSKQNGGYWCCTEAIGAVCAP